MSFAQSNDSLLRKRYKPPIADSVTSGIVTQHTESKHYFKNERYSNTYRTIFANVDTGNNFIFLQRVENEKFPFSMWIFDGDHSYYIRGRDSTIVEYPSNEKKHREIFNGFYFTKWLAKSKSSKYVVCDTILKDTIIGNIKRKYFSVVKENLPVRLDLPRHSTEGNDSITSVTTTDYYYIDSLSNIIKQENYYFMMNDTQITISDLTNIQPLTFTDARAMVFDSLNKYFSIFKSKGVSESASKLQGIKPPDSLVGEIFPSLKIGEEKHNTLIVSELPFNCMLLDFSYASCMPCHMSISDLNKIQKQFTTKNFSVIGMNPFDDQKQINYTIEKDSILYPIYSVKRSDAEELGVSSYPSFFLLDKKRNIRFVFRGYGPTLYDKLSEEIDKLMKE